MTHPGMKAGIPWFDPARSGTIQVEYSKLYHISAGKVKMIEGRGFGGWGAIEIAAKGRAGAATPTAVGVRVGAGGRRVVGRLKSRLRGAPAPQRPPPWACTRRRRRSPRGGAIEIVANGRTGAATPTAVGVHASAQADAAWWGD